MSGGPPHGTEMVVETSATLHILFSLLHQEVAKREPKNVIAFLFEYTLSMFPHDTIGVADIWLGPRENAMDRLQVARFFKSHRIPLMISILFIKAGFDNLEVLASLKESDISLVEEHNQLELLKGHRRQLLDLIRDINTKVKAFRRNSTLLANYHRETLQTFAQDTAATALSPSPVTQGSVLSHAAGSPSRSTGMLGRLSPNSRAAILNNFSDRDVQVLVERQKLLSQQQHPPITATGTQHGLSQRLPPNSPPLSTAMIPQQPNLAGSSRQVVVPAVVRSVPPPNTTSSQGVRTTNSLSVIQQQARDHLAAQMAPQQTTQQTPQQAQQLYHAQQAAQSHAAAFGFPPQSSSRAHPAASGQPGVNARAAAIRTNLSPGVPTGNPQIQGNLYVPPSPSSSSASGVHPLNTMRTGTSGGAVRSPPPPGVAVAIPPPGSNLGSTMGGPADTPGRYAAVCHSNSQSESQRPASNASSSAHSFTAPRMVPVNHGAPPMHGSSAYGSNYGQGAMLSGAYRENSYASSTPSQAMYVPGYPTQEESHY